MEVVFRPPPGPAPSRNTLLPGNHDHELAAYDAYGERFAEYNVDLVRETAITRPVGERAIRFEHGSQRDP